MTYIFGWGKFGFGPSNLKYLVLILTHQMNIGQVKNKSSLLTKWINLFVYIYTQGNEVRFNYGLTPCVENTNACLETQHFFGM